MEAIAIFGIACSVMQTISFAHEAVKVARNIRRGGNIDSNLEHTSSHLDTCMQSLRQQLERGVQPINQDCHELLDIANGSLATGAAIRAELARIRELSQKGPVHAALAWVKIITVVRGRLRELDNTMRARQRVLETQLLTRLCKTTDAIMIMNQDGFDNLDITLQRFVTASSRGQTALQNLITDESTSVKAHVTDETERLRQGIKDDISGHSKKVEDTISSTVETVQQAQVERQDRARLLKSLKYHGKDARRDQIKDPHNQTFEWIFAPPIKDDATAARWDREGARYRTSVWRFPFINYDATEVSLSDTTQQGQVNASTDDKIETSSEMTEFLNYSQDSAPAVPQWDDFVQWLGSQERRPYWVSGKAGSGKSTLMLFLAEHYRTMEILRSTKESPVIFSHYFWTAGDPLLRSTKGFLCSLLHDVLIREDTLHKLLLINFPKSNWKETIVDWSNRELEEVARYAFSVSQRHWCIFVDGIDEADEDDQPSLFNIFSRFCEIPNVQLCLSSRPEPHLRDQFREYPSLRMQDLTKPDIYKYCQDMLGTLRWKDIYEAAVFLSEMHSKSNGVFLWVTLVVGQLKQGTLYGEDFEALRAHLHALPSDLTDLYQQMWNRENCQRLAYEEDASRYLNIAVAYSDFSDFFVCGLDVTLMTLALSPPIVTSLLYNYDNSLLDELKASCKATTICVASRTAGLLEVAENGRISFIHRSALEFLNNSDFGQKVLQLDKTEATERLFDLVKGYLAYIQVVLEQLRTPAEMKEDSDIYVCAFNTLIPRFESFLGHLRNHIVMDQRIVLKVLSVAKTVVERNMWMWWAPTLENRDFLGFVIETSFFDYAAMELNSLHDSCHRGMRVSASYERFLLCRMSTALNTQNSSIASAATLFRTLLERRTNSASPETDPSYSKTQESPFHINIDLVLRFLRAVCQPDYTENSALVRRILEGLIIAECYPARFFVSLQLLWRPYDALNHYIMESLTGSTLFNHHTVGPGIYCETNIRTVLRMLLTEASKGATDVLTSTLWEEMYTAAAALAMPHLLRVVAVIPQKVSNRTFGIVPGHLDVPRPGCTSDNVCEFVGLDAINQATSSGLLGWAGRMDIQRRLVVIPGMADYVDELTEGAYTMRLCGLEDHLLSDGRFKAEDFIAHDVPIMYSPILEVKTRRTMG